jgi:hypothetical protein
MGHTAGRYAWRGESEGGLLIGPEWAGPLRGGTGVESYERRRRTCVRVGSTRSAFVEATTRASG